MAEQELAKAIEAYRSAKKSYDVLKGTMPEAERKKAKLEVKRLSHRVSGLKWSRNEEAKRLAPEEVD